MADQQPASSLSTLELDPEHLYLFLAGPGQGEGAALALPHAGWALFDGCDTSGEESGTRFPLEAILNRWGGVAPNVELLVFSHPHRDHAAGIPEIIERFPPRLIGVAGREPLVADLVHEAKLLAGTEPDPPRRDRRVIQALRAIGRWAEAHPGDLIALHDGVSIPIGVTTIHIRAPAMEYLEARAAQSIDTVTRHANRSSVVAEVEFEDTTVVLPADLPRSENGAVLEWGWDHVIQRHPSLAAHCGLKVPHHGSRDALEERLLSGASARNRAWLLTPFNSASLPRADEHDGLEQLLRFQSSLYQTALSLSRKLQAARLIHPVTRGQLATEARALSTARFFREGDTLLSAGTACGPLDPIWCVGFDRTGRIIGRWAGSAAIEVHRDALRRS